MFIHLKNDDLSQDRRVYMEYRIDNEVLQKAIDTYGINAQKVMLFEEMSELQKEVCKTMRGADNRAELVDEIADVYIMLEQIKLMEGICDGTVQHFINKKIERLKERISKEEAV